MDDEEIWLPVVGYEGLYEVSSHGRVRSLDRSIEARNRWGSSQKNRLKSRFLRPKNTKDRRTYDTVTLSKNNQKLCQYVHVLVCSAFNGPRPEGKQAAHKDGNRFNNFSSNLYWATPKENNADKLTHRTISLGERNGAAKLTEEDVRRIKLRFRAYCSTNGCKALAAEFSVSRSTICNIVYGRRWGHIT